MQSRAKNVVAPAREEVTGVDDDGSRLAIEASVDGQLEQADESQLTMGVAGWNWPVRGFCTSRPPT